MPLPPPTPPMQPPLGDDAVVVRRAILILWLSISIALPFCFALVLCLRPCTNADDDSPSVIKPPPRKSVVAAMRKSLSKPFYRWSFRQGRLFTDESIAYFTCKYLRKYLTKRQKLKIEGELKLGKSTVESLVQITMDALLKGKDVRESLSLKHANDVSGATLTGFGDFAVGLHAAASTNIGLSHAKAREYWIYRGPRQLVTTICFILGIFAINELIKRPTFEDRVVNASSSMLAMLTALIMLYYRLPDSIRSGVCRSAHDYYAQGKKNLLREARMASESAHREEASQSNSELDSNNDSDDGVRTPSLHIAHHRRRQSPGGSPVTTTFLAPIPSGSPVRSGHEDQSAQCNRSATTAADNV